MTTLHAVILRIRQQQTDASDWLCIAGPAADLALETAAALSSLDFDEETNDEIAPSQFSASGLRAILDVATVAQCITWADRLSGRQDDAAAADVIRYYIRFDAWPETLNAPDPPSADETLRQFDRAFADSLGPEDHTQRCRRDGCQRGIVSFSVLCRRHHFESIKDRPYPFDD